MPILTELITLTGTIEAKSKMALLWRPYGSKRKVWIPLSTVRKETRSFLNPGRDEIVITAWMAKKLGLT